MDLKKKKKQEKLTGPQSQEINFSWKKCSICSHKKVFVQKQRHWLNTRFLCAGKTWQIKKQ